MRQFLNSVCSCHRPKEIRLPTRVRHGLSHLKEQNFKYCLQVNINTICTCACDIESTSYFLVHCSLFTNKRCILLNTLKEIHRKLIDRDDAILNEIQLQESKFIDQITNSLDAGNDFYYIIK